jgi:diguanylate cyclase (GGDEF)-like protein
MRLSIASRVSLAIGLLLFLFFMTSTVSYLLTKRIDNEVENWGRVDEPLQDAVFRMQVDIAEAIKELYAYALDDDQALPAPAERWAENIGELTVTYLKSAASDRERALGAEVTTLIDGFRNLGIEVIGIANEERARIAAEGAQSETIARLAERKRDRLARLDRQRQQLQALLVDQVLPLIRDKRIQAENNVSFSTDIAITYILIMTGFGVVVGGGAAVLLTRGIVRPIVDLTLGAEAIGEGTLDHRISVATEDEIGKLAESFNRMAENRQRTEATLRELAHHDALTKLPNRTLFQHRLVEALDNADRTGRMVAVHYLDLDHFKDINDTLGHPAGDKLLQQVSERLKGCARKSDTVARLGGDEFAIIQTNLIYQNGITVMARRIIDAVTKPFDIDGERVFTATSVGITIFPHDDTEAEKLLKNADLALYRAKRQGGGRYQLYDPAMNAEVQARRALERDFRQALENREFFINYQPQVDIATGHIVGAEALLRWLHSERGLVSPGAFIPIAEQSGLIEQLTEFVLREACRQAKAWQEAGMPEFRVSVNLSPTDFRREDLVSLVTRTLEQSGLEPKCLELEITESMVMVEVDSVIATLRELRAVGVELAIDDFGTGYSSMSYLKKFPVHRLKIDQAFVRDIQTNKEDASITEAIIKLGHSLGLKVIAEGVETEQQLAFLALRDCDEAQGYCISPPLDPEGFAAFAASYVPLTEPRKTGLA